MALSRSTPELRGQGCVRPRRGDAAGTDATALTARRARRGSSRAPVRVAMRRRGRSCGGSVRAMERVPRPTQGTRAERPRVRRRAVRREDEAILVEDPPAGREVHPTVVFSREPNAIEANPRVRRDSVSTKLRCRGALERASGEPEAEQQRRADQEKRQRQHDDSRRHEPSLPAVPELIGVFAGPHDRLHEHQEPDRPPAADEQPKAFGIELLTAKPIIYVANIDEGGADAPSPAVTRLSQIAADEGAQLVRLCVKLEADLAELELTERETMMKELGLSSSALPAVIHESYRLLRQIQDEQLVLYRMVQKNYHYQNCHCQNNNGSN